MNPEEAAAIAAALAMYFEKPPEAPSPRVSGWKLAMRRPELSLDEVRELTRRAR